MRATTWILLFFSAYAFAQHAVSGVVKDADTGRPLAFATISEGKNENRITDVDGKFTISAKTRINKISVSYVGYQKKEITLRGEKFVAVQLSSALKSLDPVTLHQGQDPAIGIIRKAIASKSANNPQQKLRTFQFKSYNKLIVTANPDSIDGAIDSVFIRKSDGSQIAKPDSSSFRFKKLISSQHLFQMEKVSDFQFSGRRLKETVRGIRMSGFDKPVYEVVAFNLQSFSVYDNKYELFETKYNSPIARDAFSDYYYHLLDTVAVGGRQTYLVYFFPKRKYRKTGLQGLLYIDCENYAVAKAVMRLKTVLDVTATHEFEYLPDEKIWFPTNKEFKIVKGRNDEDIKILGETFQFDADGTDKKRKKQSSDFTYLQSKSWYFDRQYNQRVTISRSSVTMHVKDDAVHRTEDFWRQFRKDSLDSRSRQTYIALDSIVKKEKVETKLRIGRRLINGYVPVGAIDIDLRYLLSFNNYEGFRLGFGGVTNDRFSEKYRMEGYTAYGTKDGNFKYNIGAAARIGKFSNSWIGGAYTDDVREIASTSFAIDKRVFKLYDPRPINLSTFYAYQSWRGYIETRIIPKTESIWQLSRSVIEPKFSYIYQVDGKNYTRFNMTTAMVSLQWNPFSDFMQTPTGKIEIEKRYPKFTFQFTKSLPGILDNDFDFGKVDFRTEYQKKYLNGQKTAVFLEAGYAFGDVPLTHLYNTSPNSLTKDKVLQRLTLAGKNSFETMYFNEFFSSRYVMLQLKHGFNRVTLLRKVRPSLVLVSRMGWGDMERPEQHIGIAYKTLDKGYFESGIELNQIFKGFGLSGFYRYGPNQLPRFEDNISVKLSFILDFGI
ncbi:hypothetical protein HYN48_02200 [Flavobacterium magnum]|uniref:Carboxypeptidase-like regulatory domain-containing protein n=1 Tax=Flavobacterium magnum TaxID=2162713 RepID=A0A2S0RE56_9FLAO|nr:DUF5686 family protein [Flavobacterium magnum]AWA28992.1 hypothetical protein HYN48_02200 [Flavobacterium magnum]